MKISELNARFIGSGGPGVFNADGSQAEKREGVGVIMDCPFGDTIETLSLSPSILRKGDDSCGWHGFIRNGSIVNA